MRLELFIRGYLLDEVEFLPPPYDRFLDFEDNVKIRELCVNKMKQALKKNNKTALENQEWEIRLVIPIEIFEPEQGKEKLGNFC